MFRNLGAGESHREAGGVEFDPLLALSMFYGVGSVLIFSTLLLGGWNGANDAVLWSVACFALLVSLGVFVSGGRLPTVGVHLLVAAGTVCIGALVAGAGGSWGTPPFASFFVWVAVYAAAWFPPRLATLHVVFVMVVQSVDSWGFGHASAAASQVAVNAGSVAAAALIVGVLVARIRSLAATDALTGALNRRTFEMAVAGALGRAARTGTTASVLALDLDEFKAVNDTAGHAAGDCLLQSAAAAWTLDLRKGDVLARLGGDEFAVLLCDTDAGGSALVADRLAAATPAGVGVSVGWALSAAGDSPAGLLRRADEALYEVKMARRRARDAAGADGMASVAVGAGGGLSGVGELGGGGLGGSGGLGGGGVAGVSVPERGGVIRLS